ncbi:AMP-binding protein [Nonomuraea phyllanthi]|uniref:AMP-binding protein n=1 Tax=Nonomuraea phyllanthi TaxID=2219224 RepID=A0A5C4UUT6_9ACTN|nr:AMP-binding protein [Nonomuraea phyllanthi]
MALNGRLRRAADQHPDRPAIIESNRGTVRSITWSQLDRMTAPAAIPLGQGHRPILCVDLPNTLDGVTTLLASLRTGLPVLPLNPMTPPRERAELMDRLAATYGPVYEHDRLVAAGTGHERSCRGDYLLLTGGSTGRPVPIEGSLALGGFPTLLRRTGWKKGQRQLIVGPLYHTAPFMHLVAGILDGHTIVVQGVFEAGKTIDVLHRQAIEWVQVTPSHMRKLLAEPGLSPDRLTSLRSLVHTAGPCDDKTKRAWIDLLGADRIFEFYGATEQIGMTVARGDEWLARPGTVGKGFMTRIRILDEDRRPLPPGAVGRVFMRNGRPVSAAIEHTVNGYLSLGDLGHLDEDGYLYLTGRRQGLIIVGGSNVNSSEIEEVVLRLADVADVAVVPMPDPGLGQIPVALVVRRVGSGLTAKEIARHCRGLLSPYKRPRRIEFVDDLPRTETGKLQSWRLKNLRT